VTRHVVDLSDARDMARALAYGLAKETYKLHDARRGRAAPSPAGTVT
jgi:hypothetical protein